LAWLVVPVLFLLGLLLLMLLNLFFFESDGIGLHWQVLECV
jgi:hypothetical protein